MLPIFYLPEESLIVITTDNMTGTPGASKVPKSPTCQLEFCEEAIAGKEAAREPLMNDLLLNDLLLGGC
jgi:hypothetical protein